MAAVVVPTIKWSVFDVSKIGFSKASPPKKDGSREVYLSFDKSKIHIESPKLKIKFFNANANMTDASKMNYSISVSSENQEFYAKFGAELDTFIINAATANSREWFGSEQEHEIITDIYIPTYKPSKVGTDYDPMLTLKFYDNQIADMFIDKDNNPVRAVKLEELLARETDINCIFKLSSINCGEKAIRVRMELVRCRIIEHGTSVKVGVPYTTIDIPALKLGNLNTTKDGGKRARLIGKNGAVCLRFTGVKLGPFPVHSQNEKGEDMYGVNMILDQPEHCEFFALLDDQIKKELVSRSEEFYGKKRSAAQVKKSYISQIRLSKKDLEAVATGAAAQYPPYLKIKVMRNTDNTAYANLVAVKPDGTPFTGDINEVIPKSRDKLFDIDITCRHIWFGKDGESVGWGLSRIVVDENSVVASKIKFSDEGDGDDAGSDGSESDGGAKTTKTTADAPDSDDGNTSD
jgi:hypothetical protein